MANVILQNKERMENAEHIMDKYGVDRRDPAMREAAEIAAARTSEVLKTAENRRCYSL